MGTKRQMDQYLDTLDPDVKKNVEVVTPQSLGQKNLLHISVDAKIRTFTPNVSRRTANNENRSVPRISTAPTLAGAILGYQTLEFDYDSERERGGFRGGWYLYALPFDYALKPNKKILYDAEATEEVWLVPYTPESWSVEPKRVGKFFLDQLSIKHSGKERSVSAAIVLEITGDESLRLSPKVNVGKGYWRFEMRNFNPGWTLEEVQIEGLRELDKKEYRQLKKVNADMLSHLSTLW